MKRFVAVLLTLIFGLFLASYVFAETAKEWQKKVEQAVNAPKDRVSTGTMILIDKSGVKKIRKTKMWQKGEDLKLTRFLSPADVKNVTFLSLSDTEMYLYMPAFHKIRRIASSAKNENFMGTDFTYEDMTMNKLTEKFNAKILKEDNDTVTLLLTPKPDADVSYSKEIMVVDKKTSLPRKIDFYNKAGELEKTLANLESKRVGKYWTIMHMVMENHLTGHKTEVVTENVKFDVGLPQRLFTKRMLRRSHIRY